MSRFLAGPVVPGALALLVSTLAAASSKDLRTLDVCHAVPGPEVARLAAGQLLEAKRFNSPDGDAARCVYFVGPPGKGHEKEKGAWVVELFPPAAFSEVRPHIEEPVRDVPELGDGAYDYKDGDSGRWRLYTHHRGDVTVSVTGPNEATVRKIAAFVLSRP
jgi:hypothetical protein